MVNVKCFSGAEKYIVGVFKDQSRKIVANEGKNSMRSNGKLCVAMRCRVIDIICQNTLVLDQSRNRKKSQSKTELAVGICGLLPSFATIVAASCWETLMNEGMNKLFNPSQNHCIFETYSGIFDLKLGQVYLRPGIIVVQRTACFKQKSLHPSYLKTIKTYKCFMCMLLWLVLERRHKDAKISRLRLCSWG